MSPMSKLPLTTEHALLGFLRQRPMHGYEIHQNLCQPTGLGLVWRIKQSQLYSLLSRLEEKAYVTSTQELQDNRPPRKVFHLTEAGQEAFLEWVITPVDRPRELRLDFLAKLFFARQETTDLILRLIEGQRVLCNGWLEDHRERTAALRDDCPYEWLVWQLRIKQIEAMLEWLDACQISLV